MLRTYECHLPAELFNKNAEGSYPRAILSYRQEIDGRMEADVCPRSVAILHSKLNRIYFSRRDYQFAENHFREALKIEYERKPERSIALRRTNRLSMFDRSPLYAHLLAMTLDAQAKEKEAVETLTSIKSLTNTRRGKYIFESTIRMIFNRGWEQNSIFPTREFLVDLLSRQHELSKILNMDLFLLLPKS